MTELYKTPLISFFNETTQSPMIHPEGDYSDLNIKIERLEKLISKYQPNEPIILLYKPPLEVKKVKKEEEKKKEFMTEKEKIMSIVFAGRELGYEPIHVFMIPNIGESQSMTKMIKENKFNEITVHKKILNDLINDITSRMEIEYDCHPLHYEKKVEFRKAQYIDNRQAFSFWPEEKPFGDYPLSKPLFDNLIEQLNIKDKNYKIYIDFVTDWEEKYSSFSGPPKSYAIEVNVLIDKKNVLVSHKIKKEELSLCRENHDFLDEKLAPIFNEVIQKIQLSKKPKIK